ncbi:Cell surface glycoprotein 1 [Rhizoctonia solani]|uniref:Cell surface glycoprotein 1 n=1 Tax=Rhizoctonia solani TaxID=456999 RepID=A0A0K6FQP5_9AGAM|nr:Cell surface glycoprotein 1 [Rhizoctonia solani]
MEISPAKSLGIVSDSEGEEDRVGITMDDMFERELNAARSSDPRDWHHSNRPATIAANLSTNISQFTTPPGQALAMQAESSTIADWDSSATKPRPRPRPRMRPVPPPDRPDSSSISNFPTIPSAAPSIPETVASFGNSTVQGVPAAHPPSLPPSSLPGPDSSSSIPTPTFPTSVSSLRPPANQPPPETNSGVVPPTLGAETTSTVPKRPRPKMRPPPPPEPDSAPALSSAPTANFSTDPNNTASTGATSVSSTSKSNPPQNSALDQAEEYTGRGARRLGQSSKLAPPPPFPDADVDVGGPEDTVNDVIMLISSDDEYAGSKAKAKPKPKPKAKPKPKKKDTPKADSIPAQSGNPGEQIPPPAKATLKRKSAKLQSSDDEFGRWDATIPGGSAPKEPISNNEGRSCVQPVVPNTIDPANPNPIDGPGYQRATSSPLSSPGRSPELKRKDPPNPAADETVAPSPVKKPRKSGFLGVVITAPSSDGKPKRTRKKSAKAAAVEEDDTGYDQPYVPPALSSVADTSTSVVPSESSKTKTTPPTSSGPSVAAQEPTNATMDVDEAAAPAKKQPKKRAPKGKKSAATEEPANADGSAQEGPAPKKSAKGKGKGKEKEKEETSISITVNDEAAGTTSSNPDAIIGPATSSNPSSNSAPQPTSSNPAQTSAPKPKPRPRHSTTPAPMPVAMGASGALRSASGKSSDRPLSETIRLAMGGTGSPAPRMGLSRRGSSKIAPLLAFRGAPPPPPPPMPKKPTKKKKGDSDDEDSEEGPEWEGLTEKQKEKKRREKEMAGWYSDG